MHEILATSLHRTQQQRLKRTSSSGIRFLNLLLHLYKFEKPWELTNYMHPCPHSERSYRIWVFGLCTSSYNLSQNFHVYRCSSDRCTRGRSTNSSSVVLFSSFWRPSWTLSGKIELPITLFEVLADTYSWTIANIKQFIFDYFIYNVVETFKTALKCPKFYKYQLPRDQKLNHLWY